ncbi:MAG: aminoacetone oxidase family FAD-binding enzyme [Patescibacteria group bacterium]
MPESGNTHDVIVVGGGASGMMAAGIAAEQGKRVLLIEKNAELGKKLSISGGGRCNILNAEEDVHALLANYGEAAPFLYSAFAEFGVQEATAFFERIGVPIVVEARKRAFPVSQRAVMVVEALEEYLRERGVEIRTNTSIARVKTEGNRITAIVAQGFEFTADNYIFATGGVSHPETGSTGDGFDWLAELGHTVTAPTPTIVPLAVKEKWLHSLKGTTLSDAKITFYLDGARKFSKRGDILLRHFCFSGPTILNAAGDVADLLYEGVVTATMDMFPTKDIGILDKELVALFDSNKNKLLRNTLPQLIPSSAVGTLLSLVPNISPETKVHSVTKEERRALIDVFKGLPITISGLMGMSRAVVADGGVALTEIDMRTMQSKKIENLFVTGDLLDITRPSGG